MTSLYPVQTESLQRAAEPTSFAGSAQHRAAGTLDTAIARAECAVLTAQLDKKRATLLVSRGNFDEEIYRIR